MNRENGDMNRIGWHNFLHGRVARNLREILLHAAEADNKKRCKNGGGNYHVADNRRGGGMVNVM